MSLVAMAALSKFMAYVHSRVVVSLVSSVVTGRMPLKVLASHDSRFVCLEELEQ